MILPNYSTLVLNIILVSGFILIVNKGYKKGLINQLFGFFSMFIAIVIAWILYIPFGKLFAVLPKNLAPFQSTILSSFFYQKTNAFLWFIILFIVALIIIKFIGKVLEIISKVPIINKLNQILGLGFSLINYVVFVLLLVFGLSLPIFINGSEVIDKSLLKYSDQVNKTLFSKVEKPLDQLQSTQHVIKSPKQATVSDVENMQAWLVNNKVNISEISEFFKEIKDE